jgi:hypothetical protein
MKFKVGDKVTVREDLSRHEWNVVSDMEQYCGKVATITGAKGIDEYSIDLDDGWWYWNDSMFEESKEEKEKDDEVENKTGDKKFRAFLNEVARGDKSADNDEYYEMYSNLSDVVTAPNDNCETHEEVDAFIDAIVEFYSSFEPKPIPKPKKMTLEEIEAELGYKIELVED